jgi:signal transduction histidine kinase
MFYAQYLANNLADREINTVELYVNAIESINKNDNINDELIMENLIQEKLGTIPIILEGEDGTLDGNNYGELRDTDQEFLRKRKEKILESGFEPLKGPGGYAKYIYYENSTSYKLISLFPLAQILLLSTFVIFGYFVISSTRKAEQNRVWAGMAKETAHQLGTPISAIIGWIEHLKDISQGKSDQLEVVTELRKDVDRLELIADRFSKIGSLPTLEKTDLKEELSQCLNYMKKRASKKIIFDFPPEQGQSVYAKINPHLFDWVIENLMRNALDAMDEEGTIGVQLYVDNTTANIEISDTGKGIPTASHKTIFKPGYTTKKRGWGLGLSLAKRIIEEYHKGKIFVKFSKPNEGTTFAIQLPVA